MRGAIVHRGLFHSMVDVHDGPIAFLDRDGVINVGKAGYVNAPCEVELLPKVATTIAALKMEGYAICVVTNQSAITRGLWGVDQLHSIHTHLEQLLMNENEDARIDLFITCPHHYESSCRCRKPRPGMLHLGHQLLRTKHGVSLDVPSVVAIPEFECDWWGNKPKPHHSLDLMVGDRRSDLGAGWATGVRLFKVAQHLGLSQRHEDVLNVAHSGDDFQP